jgi:hypothetical protein
LSVRSVAEESASRSRCRKLPNQLQSSKKWALAHSSPPPFTPDNARLRTKRRNKPGDPGAHTPPAKVKLLCTPNDTPHPHKTQIQPNPPGVSYRQHREPRTPDLESRTSHPMATTAAQLDTSVTEEKICDLNHKMAVAATLSFLAGRNGMPPPAGFPMHYYSAI